MRYILCDRCYWLQLYSCTLASPALGHCGTFALVIQHCNLFSSRSSSTEYKVSLLPVQQCIVYSDVPVPPHTKSWRCHCTYARVSENTTDITDVIVASLKRAVNDRRLVSAIISLSPWHLYYFPHSVCLVFMVLRIKPGFRMINKLYFGIFQLFCYFVLLSVIAIHVITWREMCISSCAILNWFKPGSVVFTRTMLC